MLDQLATCLTTGPLKGKAISLIGRADPRRHAQEYPLRPRLAARFVGVSTYLAHLGVGQPQLGVTTRGSISTLTGTDQAGWAKDRRVDIQLKQVWADATRTCCAG